MHDTLLAAATLAVALGAPPARAEPPVPAGQIEAGDSRFEILGRPLRAGDRIDLPEGYLVVEESGPDDGQAGSFGVVPAETFAAGSAAEPAAPEEANAPADAAPGGAAACTAERSAYLAELWRASGIIDVKDPAALLEGLQGGATGPATGYYWFALATDAFRNLAWSSELRSRANALASCVRAHPG
jgi:hypothetical protein